MIFFLVKTCNSPNRPDQFYIAYISPKVRMLESMIYGTHTTSVFLKLPELLETVQLKYHDKPWYNSQYITTGNKLTKKRKEERKVSILIMYKSEITRNKLSCTKRILYPLKANNPPPQKKPYLALVSRTFQFQDLPSSVFSGVAFFRWNLYITECSS